MDNKQLTVDALAAALKELEARVEKLEKALGSGNAPKTDDYEQIIKVKGTSSCSYFLTNKDRILCRHDGSTIYFIKYTDNSRTTLDPKFLAQFKSVLLWSGDEDLLASDSANDFLACLAALRTKYRALGSLPCLMPNMSAIQSDGTILPLTESSKKIKF
ncbi:MAG: hypothetical protein K2I69_01210 [Muribaculaceae bacterium]|nr:hypothetical protein [Muribaculaceae bacterium]